MKKLMLTLSLMLACATLAVGQNIQSKKSSLAMGSSAVTVTEQDDVKQAVRTVEQRNKPTKINGYTILILSDNSQTARENANKAKELFEENFKDTKVKMYYESPSFYVTAGHYLTKEEAIIELWRFRAVFPKAITQNREIDITEFIIRPDEMTEEGDNSAKENEE